MFLESKKKKCDFFINILNPPTVKTVGDRERKLGNTLKTWTIGRGKQEAIVKHCYSLNSFSFFEKAICFLLIG